MKTLLSALIETPGGWSYRDFAPKRELSMLTRIGGVLLLLGMIIAFGLGVSSRYLLIVSAPVLVLAVARALRNWYFLRIPADTACRWPKDLRADAKQSYFYKVYKVTTVWVIILVVCGLAAELLIYGLGEFWNPLARDLIAKRGPYREFGLAEVIYLVSGFLSLTSVVWWPMIVFFEWLMLQKRLAAIGGAHNA